MPAILRVAPSSEPVTVAAMKAFLRIEHDDDDTLLSSLIAAARSQIEAMTRCFLISQTWQFTRNQWPQDGRIRLRCGPLKQLIEVRVADHTGEMQVVDDGSFVLDPVHNTIAAPVFALPQPGLEVAGIEFDVKLGFGTASDVPPVLKHAVQTLVTHWYENRGLIAIGGARDMIPLSVQAMIGSYRVASL